MGFRQGAYARMWSVNDMGNYSTANISISKKDKETGEYRMEFNDGYVRLVGDAHSAANELGLPTKENFDPKNDKGVRIQITSCDVTNSWSKKDNKLYTNCVIFGFDVPEDGGGYNSSRGVVRSSSRSGGQRTQYNQGSRGGRQTSGYNQGGAYAPNNAPEQDDDEDLPF